jgi:hypothetical protein
MYGGSLHFFTSGLGQYLFDYFLQIIIISQKSLEVKGTGGSFNPRGELIEIISRPTRTKLREIVYLISFIIFQDKYMS